MKRQLKYQDYLNFDLRIRHDSVVISYTQLDAPFIKFMNKDFLDERAKINCFIDPVNWLLDCHEEDGYTGFLIRYGGVWKER